MEHLPQLVTDLALLLAVAGIVTIVCKKLKQPLVLGYVIAGFLVSPAIGFIPNIIDTENISTWSEIGVIFLMFGLGLEFSIVKLTTVGKPAIVTALVEMILMIAAGMLCGTLLGWSFFTSLFLGGMVVLAHTIGFSAALGAFLAGSILAGTVQAHRIEELFKPIKDLFGAVFFVSVGMLVAPDMIAQNIIPIIAITVVTLIGKPIFSALGAMLSGQSLKTSVKTGLSLSQIGEFSFIIAALGVSLGVTADCPHRYRARDCWRHGPLYHLHAHGRS